MEPSENGFVALEVFTASDIGRGGAVDVRDGGIDRCCVDILLEALVSANGLDELVACSSKESKGDPLKSKLGRVGDVEVWRDTGVGRGGGVGLDGVVRGGGVGLAGNGEVCTVSLSKVRRSLKSSRSESAIGVPGLDPNSLTPKLSMVGLLPRSR